MNEVKIVIGANYGDEGKGLMTRHFALDALNKHMKPVVIFHNGTAQRGHTVDYTETERHVYHHFGSGTGDKVPTFFANTFLIHPMEFHREYNELYTQGIYPPINFCDPKCSIITPFDMAVDHATEDYIAIQKGEREFGSCGFGSWCATDRIPHCNFTIEDFSKIKSLLEFEYKMFQIRANCIGILQSRGVQLEKIPNYKDIFWDKSQRYFNIVHNFYIDMLFFLEKINLISYENLWKKFDYHIFENGQGLGLDVNNGNEWHTTSHTGMYNPYNMLRDKNTFNAETCYVSRAYLTRHGEGPLEELVKKKEINENMIDLTNVHNDFQGSLRYGFLENKTQLDRIVKDYSIVAEDNRFKCEFAITHTNEFNCGNQNTKYYSDSKFMAKERK